MVCIYDHINLFTIKSKQNLKNGQMTSVERVLEYTNLPSEKTSCEKQPLSKDNSWPSSGEITFENVSFSYDKTSSPVLKDLSFRIKPGEKIGIMGRTGAGKSSIIQTLFRMADHSSGRILIDNVNIAEIELSNLRNKLSVIPV
jgi:ABC-type multidrug transport system fused ATPase/permease subunit